MPDHVSRTQSALTLDAAAQGETAIPGGLPAASLFGQVLLFFLLALLIFAVLAFGAVQPWSIAVLETGAALLFLAWAARQVFSPRLETVVNPLYAPMLLFAALVVAQMVFGLTAYRYATFSEALRYAAYGMLFFVFLQSARTETHLKWFVGVASVFGFLLALFALIQGFTSNGKLYWVKEVSFFGSWIYGPYINHNHYAGIMEMLAAIPLSLSLTGSITGVKRALLAFAGIVMAGSIFLSGSRGGMAAFVVQMILLGTVVLGQRKGRTAALMLGSVLLFLFVFLAWLGGGQVAARISGLHDALRLESTAGRWPMVRDSLRMFAHKPLAGWGLGSFSFVYPQFRSFYTNYLVNQAHNDYVQMLAETGVMGLAATAWFLVLMFRRAFRRLEASSRFSNAARLAALVGCSGILVHSLFDFNLHIPANAAWFYVLCAMASGNVQPRARRALSSPTRGVVNG